MATHCSILAWRIPRREETGGFHRTTESDRSEQLTHTHSLKARGGTKSFLAFKVSGRLSRGA